MTKYITVKLTEDQVRDLASLIEGWMPSAQWWLDAYSRKLTSGELNTNNQELHRYNQRHWSTEQYETTIRKIGFRQRLLKQLAKAKS